MCNICVQYQSSCATKLGRKCEDWTPVALWCGRTGSGRCTVTWLPNFLGWVNLLTHGVPQARFARQGSAINYIMLLQNNITQSVRSKDCVDYVALNNLSSADFETASKGRNRKYKPGANYIKWKDLSASGNRYWLVALILGLFGHIDRGSNH